MEVTLNPNTNSSSSVMIIKVLFAIGHFISLQCLLINLVVYKIMDHTLHALIQWKKSSCSKLHSSLQKWKKPTKWKVMRLWLPVLQFYLEKEADALYSLDRWQRFKDQTSEYLF